MQKLSLDLNSLAGSALSVPSVTQPIREQMKLLLKVPKTLEEVEQLIEAVLTSQRNGHARAVQLSRAVDMNRLETLARQAKFLIVDSEEIDYV